MKLTKEQTERALKQTGMIFVHVYKRERKPVVRGVWDYIGGDEVDGGEGAVDCAKDSIRRKPVCYTNNQPSRIKYGTSRDKKGAFLQILIFKIVLEEEEVCVF